MRALRALAGACRTVHAPWSRHISGNDLSRRAISAPNTVARVSEQQFLADDESYALVKRRQKMRDEQKALLAAETAALEAASVKSTPSKPFLDITEDQIRTTLLLTSFLAAGVGLFAS